MRRPADRPARDSVRLDMNLAGEHNSVFRPLLSVRRRHLPRVTRYPMWIILGFLIGVLMAAVLASMGWLVIGVFLAFLIGRCQE